MIRTERQGAVTTVILDRRHARNAVDRDTADQLAEAFRTFALAKEFALGSHALAEAFAGAARFAGGAGRHGGPA